MGKVKNLYMDEQEKLYEEAYETVLRLRGSSDVPGFALCVQAELENLKNAKQK